MEVAFSHGYVSRTLADHDTAVCVICPSAKTILQLRVPFNPSAGELSTVAYFNLTRFICRYDLGLMLCRVMNVVMTPFDVFSIFSMRVGITARQQHQD